MSLYKRLTSMTFASVLLLAACNGSGQANPERKLFNCLSVGMEDANGRPTLAKVCVPMPSYFDKPNVNPDTLVVDFCSDAKLVGLSNYGYEEMARGKLWYPNRLGTVTSEPGLYLSPDNQAVKNELANICRPKNYAK